MNAIQTLVCGPQIDMGAVGFFALVFLAMAVFFTFQLVNSKSDDGILYGLLTGFFSAAAFIIVLIGLLQ